MLLHVTCHLCGIFAGEELSWKFLQLLSVLCPRSLAVKLMPQRLCCFLRHQGPEGRVPHKNHLGIFILFLDLLHVYFHLAKSDFPFLPLSAEIKLRDVTTS